MKEIDRRLVERTPQRTQIAERAHDLTYKTLKVSRQFIPGPAIVIGDPQRVGKVMQRNHRRDAAFAQCGQHLSIMIQRGVIPSVRLRLDPAPFDGQSMRVVVHLGGPVKVLGVAPGPPIASATNLLILADVTRCLLPAPPIVDVLALDLVGGGRTPPQESLWELI